MHMKNYSVITRKNLRYYISKAVLSEIRMTLDDMSTVTDHQLTSYADFVVNAKLNALLKCRYDFKIIFDAFVE